MIPLPQKMQKVPQRLGLIVLINSKIVIFSRRRCKGNISRIAAVKCTNALVWIRGNISIRDLQMVPLGLLFSVHLPSHSTFLDIPLLLLNKEATKVFRFTSYSRVKLTLMNPHHLAMYYLNIGPGLRRTRTGVWRRTRSFTCTVQLITIFARPGHDVVLPALVVNEVRQAGGTVIFVAVGWGLIRVTSLGNVWP